MGFFSLKRRPATEALDHGAEPRASTLRLNSAPEPCASTVILNPVPQLCASAISLNPVPNPAPTAPEAPRPRRRALKIARLYPQNASPLPADLHVAHLAKALIDASDDFPELLRRWIPKEDLQKYYLQICQANAWEPLHWTLMGRALAKVAHRRRPKINNRHKTCYKISRT